MARKRKRNSYGLAVELTYPREMVQEIADLLTDWRIPLDKAMTVIQRELAAKAYRDSRPQPGVEVHRLDETPPPETQRIAFAQVLRMASSRAQRPPRRRLVLALDDESQNAYSVLGRQLVTGVHYSRRWFIARIENLEDQVMSLDTSDKLKAELLRLLERLTDLEQTPDYARQKAICETSQTLINLLRAEIAYVREVNGDAEIPFLEPAREARAAAKRKPPLLQGPAPDHPWRGLGDRGDR